MLKKISFGIVASILVTSLLGVYAQSDPNPISSQDNDSPAVTKAQATISIKDPKITSRTNNMFVVDFDIRNEEGAQPDVRYGISLIKKEGDNSYVVDEKVYDEVLNLSENSSVHRKVTYNAPTGESGEYQMRVSSKNSEGVPYTVVVLGTVDLQTQKNSVLFKNSDCNIKVSSNSNKATTYSIDQIIEVAATDKMTLSCSLRNDNDESATISPRVTQYANSKYGEVVSGTDTSSETIILDSDETKTFSLPIDIKQSAGGYVVNVEFSNVLKKETIKNIIFKYRLSGVNGSIKSLKLDKDNYKSGDTAVVSALVYVSDGTVENRELSNKLTINITDKNGNSCGLPVTDSDVKSSSLVDINFPIQYDCKDPKVSAELVNPSNLVLDNQDFSITTNINPNEKNIHSTTYNLLILLALIALVGGAWLIHKRIPAKTLPVIAIIIIVSSITGVSIAKAATGYTTLQYQCGSGCPEGSQIWVSYSLNKETYAPGENIYMYGSFTGDDYPQPPSGCNINPVMKGSLNGGQYSADIFPNPYCPEEIRSSVTSSPYVIGQANASGNVTFLISSNGYYSQTKVINYTVTAPPTVQLWFSSIVDKMKNLSSTLVTSVFALNN